MPRNWDDHYADPSKLDFTPSALVVKVAELAPPGQALDLASGHGRNALYLAGLGWQVTAVDSSAAAIRILRERSDGKVDARVADLEAGEFEIAPGGYDLICDILYLQRDLFPAIREGVRLGGVFAGEILFSDGNAGFALGPGELREEFAGWKILYYSEGLKAGGSRRAARILARRA